MGELRFPCGVARQGLSSDDRSRAGWLNSECRVDLSPRRVIQPRPGHLTRFPAYMWHGTVPFEAPEKLVDRCIRYAAAASGALTPSGEADSPLRCALLAGRGLECRAHPPLPVQGSESMAAAAPGRRHLRARAALGPIRVARRRALFRIRFRAHYRVSCLVKGGIPLRP